MAYAYDDIVTAKDIRTGKVRKEDIIGKQGWFFDTIPSDMSEDAIEHIEPSGYGVLTDISMADAFPFYEAGCDSWICFLPEKDRPYEERQAEWIKANDIGVGDKVRILRKFEPYEDGCSAQMNREGRMNRLIGTVGKICLITDGAISVMSEGFDYPWLWPYFVLEKVDEEYIPFDLSLQEDRDALRDRWVRSRCTGIEARVIGIAAVEVILGDRGYTAEELLEDFTFLDGSPVGKKEEMNA